jgi:pimeloyl-ACP methyl ester carboxylesterase
LIGEARAIELDDGRVLAYREYGDLEGFAVVNCHGGLLGGLDVAPFDAPARALGLRLVSPDRPGLGASGPAPGRTTADWASDVGQLLDVLEIELCAVFGWSMGGQYALACAARLGDRVTRTTVVAGCLPIDVIATFEQLNAMDRRLTRLAQHHPHVAAETFRALGEMARHAPRAWAHATMRGAVPDEKSTIEGLPTPGIAAAAAAALQGGEGMVEEYRAWARPWGFAVKDVVGTVDVWQGDRDELIPPAWGIELARQTPKGRLHAIEGGGHFIGYTHTAEILGSLAH